jgi:hypothetical protein
MACVASRQHRRVEFPQRCSRRGMMFCARIFILLPRSLCNNFSSRIEELSRNVKHVQPYPEPDLRICAIAASQSLPHSMKRPPALFTVYAPNGPAALGQAAALYKLRLYFIYRFLVAEVRNRRSLRPALPLFTLLLKPAWRGSFRWVSTPQPSARPVRIERRPDLGTDRSHCTK